MHYTLNNGTDERIFLGRNRTKPALSVKNGGGEETKTRRERKERGKGQNDEMRYREGKGG